MIGMIKVGTLHEAFEEEDSNGEQAKPDFIDDVAARVNIEFISPSMKMDPFSWATQVLFVLWDVGVIWTNRAVDANAAVYEGATAEIIRLGVEEWWQNWIEDRPRRGSRKVTVVEYTELQ